MKWSDLGVLLLLPLAACQSKVSITSDNPNALLINSDILYVGTGSVIKAYDVPTGAAKAGFEWTGGHTGTVQTLVMGTVGGNEEFLFSGGLDGIINQWSLQTHQVVKTFKGNTGEVWQILLLDGRFLVSGKMIVPNLTDWL